MFETRNVNMLPAIDQIYLRLIQNNYMSPHLQSIECAVKCNLIKAITAYTHEEEAKIKESAKIYTSSPTG